MFWCFLAELASQGIFPSQSTSYSSLPESTSQIKPSFQFQETGKKAFIDLTEQDLQKAGYQNKKTPWTEEEDRKLKNYYHIQGKDWEQIAELLPGRNSKMCYSRFRRLQYQTKNPWKKSEDDRLIQLVGEIGENWKQIANHFKNRSMKQLKEHYVNYLRPGIKKDDWTLQQDLKLVDLLNQYGKDWKLMEKYFQGRTQNQIKNRYFGRLKKLAEQKEAYILEQRECQYP